jgi:hypothetical protein
LCFVFYSYLICRGSHDRYCFLPQLANLNDKLQTLPFPKNYELTQRVDVGADASAHLAATDITLETLHLRSLVSEQTIMSDQSFMQFMHASIEQ